jgi:phosphatidylinositol alpha-1,6-mannosyltransferase
MRALLLTQDFPPRPGGMARYYADLARGLGEDCAVAVGSWSGAPPMRDGEYDLLRLPFDAGASHRLWNLGVAHRRVRSALVGGRFDVVIAGNIRPYGPLVHRLARAADLPFAVVYHGNDLLRTARRWRESAWRRGTWSRLTAAARLHVVNSAYTARLGIAEGLPSDRIAVVPPEVDVRRFHPAANDEERTELRRRFGWGETDRVALFVGRLVERKGLDDLFIALRGLPRSARLVVAGPGDADRWRERAREAEIADRVSFLGSVDDETLPLLYRAADLFTGPSRERLEADDVEGFGIVFLEASASGLAVLSTRTGGIPEAVEDGVGGILVSPDRPEELAKAWLTLSGDAGLCRRLGEGGRRGRAAAHGPGSSARGLRDALSKSLHRSGAPGSTPPPSA